MSSFRRGIGVKEVGTDKLAYVVAFDPGETTGWAILGCHPDDLRWPRGDLTVLYADYGQIDCRSQSLDGWENTIAKHEGINLEGENVGVDKMLAVAFTKGESPIVFEDFILDFNQATSARHTLSPVRLTAAFSFGLQYQGGSLSQIFIQNRSLAKTTCTDKRLKTWGLYDSSSGPHARDATRHAYYFLRSASGSDRKAEIIRGRAWPHLFEQVTPMEKKKRKPKPLGERI